MIKHKYPKQRKPRNTEYSITWQVLNKIGKDKLYNIWKTEGHRGSARILSNMLDFYVSAGVVQYIATKKFHWIREVPKTSIIYKAVANGKIKADAYITIKFV